MREWLTNLIMKVAWKMYKRGWISFDMLLDLAARFLKKKEVEEAVRTPIWFSVADDVILLRRVDEIKEALEKQEVGIDGD